MPHRLRLIFLVFLLGIAPGCADSPEALFEGMLPVAAHADSLEDSSSFPRTYLEVRTVGNVILNGVLIDEAGGAGRPKLRSALREELDQWSIDSMDYSIGDPSKLPALVLLADGRVPLELVQDVLECLQFMDLQWRHVLFGVREACGSRTLGLQVFHPVQVGTDCGEPTVAAGSAVWTIPSAAGDKRRRFVLERRAVDPAARISTSKMPTIPIEQDSDGDLFSAIEDLHEWLDEAAARNAEVVLKSADAATWQDFITLIDTAISTSLQAVGGLLLPSPVE